MPRRCASSHRIPARLQRLIPLLAEGMTNEEMAAELSLSKQTVENYVSELMHLTEARDRT